MRDQLPPACDDDPDGVVLEKFLRVALDKWDDNYDYATYLGIDLLGLVPDADGATAGRQREEWVGLLLADVWTFERGARDGEHDWLPLQRPDPELLDRRMRLLATTLARELHGCESGPAPASEHEDDVDEAVRKLLASVPPQRLLLLSLSMQPVYVAHDEYLFIRVLQSYEVTFAAMAGRMRDAIDAVGRGLPEDAAESITRCGAGLASARRLFTLLATMQPESFHDFRTYTVGASAIQSGNYKTFEALCSRPPDSRMDSPAFDAVPHVRDRVRAEWTDLTTAVEDAVAQGLFDGRGLERIVAAAGELERVHQQWKQTHWRLADRMIGDEVGTGYTVGVPYLRTVVDNRLFGRLRDFAAEAGRA